MAYQLPHTRVKVRLKIYRPLISIMTKLLSACKQGLVGEEELTFGVYEKFLADALFEKVSKIMKEQVGCSLSEKKNVG
jgi:hypothetical protein